MTPEQLAADEEWISAVAQASRVAMGTHLEEKIRMLKKVLETLVLEPERNTVVVGRFLRYVEEFEPRALSGSRLRFRSC